MIPKDVLEDLYWNKEMSSIQIADKFNMKHPGTVRKWMEKYEIPRRAPSEANRVYSKQPFNGNMNFKSYLLGLRAGDVHAKRAKLQIRVQTTTTHPAQIEMMERVFGKFSNVGKHRFFNKQFGTDQWFVYCDIDKSFSFMLKKPNRIPKWVMKNDERFFNFLAGYLDSEGCWKILKSHENCIRYVLQIASQDKVILHQIVKRLGKLGYKANIYLDQKGGTTKHGVKVNKDMYRIMIYRTDNIFKLIDILLPLSFHQEKIDKMNLMVGSIGKKWDEVKDGVKALREEINSSRIQTN